MSYGHEHFLAFRDSMEKEGIVFKGELVADGKIHRVHVEGDRKGSRNAWYLLHLDGRPAGAFGCWKKFGAEKIKWVAERGAARITDAERAEIRAKIDADKARRAAEQEAVHATAAERANRIWDAAETATGKHPYLKKKGVLPHDIRVGDWVMESKPDPETGEISMAVIKNALLIPIKRRKDIVSLQAIFPSDRNRLGLGKCYLADGQKAGCYFPIGGKPTEYDGKLTFVFGEGYSTCASIHESTAIWSSCVSMSAISCQSPSYFVRHSRMHGW